MKSKNNIHSYRYNLAKINELHCGLSRLSIVNVLLVQNILTFYLTQKYNIIYNVLFVRIRGENITTLAGITAICFETKHISNELRSF